MYLQKDVPVIPSPCYILHFTAQYDNEKEEMYKYLCSSINSFGCHKHLEVVSIVNDKE